ncbi:kinase-like domain-containing protein [Parachaetomium inaequale]|uniref:non-specific serine/threonine protein kinase n=1 Tax=Parachaetomium inaequale TaxID=2588326 RepID=A0AAN6PEM8_9PEZI|nr:kinase-like domain-containing protein [Parachaetomium inaequale]
MSFDSKGSQSSQGRIIPLSDFLSCQDDHHFAWDDTCREMSDEWLAPVEKAHLDPKKHKVFHHNSKEYLKPPSPFVQQDQLGESGSTIVYKVTPPEGYAYRRPLALKVIVCKENSRPPGPDSKARSDALKEVKTMSSLRHPHIVAYVASFEDYCIQTREIRRHPRGRGHSVLFRVNQRIKKHVLGIAMYPPAQWNLHTFMDDAFQSPKEAEWILPHLHTYFGCLAQAVAYLHRQKIRHKDIKPDNIVIDDFGLPVLTDFGLSKHFETGQYSEGPTPKTLKYADPEAMHEERRNERSDIFSLGCVFLEMATVLLGRPPKFAEDQLAHGGGGGGGGGDGHSISSSGTGTGCTGAEFKYSESLQNLDAYLTTLSLVARDVVVVASDPAREASVKAVLSILPHIRRMMDETQTLRPAAHQLYPWFRHLYDVYDIPGPCPNCEEERRTGRAIPSPSRSGRCSPTLNRSGTMGGVGSNGGGVGAPSSSQGLLVRRGTAASSAMSMSLPISGPRVLG